LVSRLCSFFLFNCSAEEATTPPLPPRLHGEPFLFIVERVVTRRRAEALIPTPPAIATAAVVTEFVVHLASLNVYTVRTKERFPILKRY
jgi:hypothetical protein